MKKRVLSVLLAVMMLVSAVPMVLPTFAATESEFTEADYNALYVQDKLVYAADFFRTNAYWGGESYSVDAPFGSKAEANALLNSFDFKTHRSSSDDALQLNITNNNNGVGNETVAIANGMLDTSGIYQLLVSVVDSALGLASNGLTMEMVATMKETGRNGPQFILNDHRYNGTMSAAAGGFKLNSIVLLGAPKSQYDPSSEAYDFCVLWKSSAEGNCVLPFGGVKTFSFTQLRPASTQDYYNFVYANEGVELPEADKDIAGNALKLNARTFYVAHKATMDGETVTAVNAVTPVPYDYFSYEPIFAEFEGKKYVVNAIHRSVSGNGEGGPLYCAQPGKLGIAVGGEAILEDDAVRYPDNAKSASYLRFNGGGADMLLGAVRYYGKILSAEERAQNHFADLAKWFKLDIKAYMNLNKNDRAAVIAMMQDFTIESDRDAVVAALRASCDSIAYDFLLDGLLPGDAYNVAAQFVGTAKEFQLSVADVKLLTEDYRAMVYAAVNGFGGLRTAEALQKVIDDKIDEIVDTYYGKYIDKNEYDYRDLYVKQDDLYLAVDFFDAKPTDEPAYVGVSYDEWPAEYKKYNDLYNELQRWAPGQANVARNWQAMGYATLDEAFSVELEKRYGVFFPNYTKAVQTARDKRVETKRENNWDTLIEKYLWKGNAEDFAPLDISDKGYPHTNIRTYGDGSLICDLNNSVMARLQGNNDNSDVTYQVVGKINGGNWQLRGFRMAFTGSTAVSNVQYAGVSVKGTENAPTFTAGNIGETITYAAADRPSVPTVNSVDMTVSIDKRPGADPGQYYSYKWNNNKFDVTRVPEGTEGAYGPEVFHGLMDMSIIMNGQLKATIKDAPYMQQTADSLGNSGSNIYYAIRIYKCTLTPEEVQQNHFADLAGLYDLDLSLYYRMSMADRERLHKDLSGVELGSAKSDVVAFYEEAVRFNYYYTLDTDTEAGKAFVALAEENFLNISSFLSISAATRERIYQTVMNDPDVASGASWLAPILQGKVEGILSKTVDEHFAESIVDTLIELGGYQLNLYGDKPGMRAVFEIKEDQLGLLDSRYDAEDINVTLGMMLLPEANATDAITVENGEIKLPDSAIESVVAYENGYTDAVFYMNGASVYALEYYPEGEAVNAKVAYVGYICVEIAGEEPVIGYAYYNGNIARGNAFSLTELAVYAKENLGMAHKNIQTLTNAAKDEAFISLLAGKADLSEYAICVTKENAIAVEALQKMIGEYLGITLKEIDADKVGATDHVLYLGGCDTVYTDKDLYGIQVRGDNLYLFYNDPANVDATLSRFASILNMAYADGCYEMAVGVSYVYHARGLAE